MVKIILVPTGPYSLSNLTDISEQFLTGVDYTAFFADNCELKMTNFFISDCYAVRAIYNQKAPHTVINDIIRLGAGLDEKIYGKVILVKYDQLDNKPVDFTIKEFQVLFNHKSGANRFKFEEGDVVVNAIKKTYGIKVKKSNKLVKRDKSALEDDIKESLELFTKKRKLEDDMSD